LDECLAARRLESSAWDGGVYNVSAGWQSPLDLYCTQGAVAAKWPTAEALSALPPDARAAALAAIQADCDRLVVNAAAGETAAGFPFAPSDGGLLGAGSALGKRRRVTVLQREGELLLIPPRWWHQTYHLEPSVALAGQYCNAQNGARVAQHVLDWCGVGAEARAALAATLSQGAPQAQGAAAEGSDRAASTANASLSLSVSGRGAGDARLRIERVLKAALSAKHGEKKGGKLYRKLKVGGN
jgi:hypothetical protein